MTPKCEAAKAAMRKAQRAFDRAVYSQQRKCRHLDIAEAPYLHSDYGSSLPPMRVCLRCGMVEDGWCCGYLILNGASKTITRDELYKIRHGVHITDEHKGPLLRREVSIRDLIECWWGTVTRR